MFSEAAKGMLAAFSWFIFFNVSSDVYFIFSTPSTRVNLPPTAHLTDRQHGRYDKTPPRTGLPANGEFAMKSLSDPRQMYFIPGLMRFLFIYRRVADPKQIRVKCTKAHPTRHSHTRTHTPHTHTYLHVYICSTHIYI